jgi:hypothetical protein
MDYIIPIRETIEENGCHKFKYSFILPKEYLVFHFDDNKKIVKIHSSHDYIGWEDNIDPDFKLKNMINVIFGNYVRSQIENSKFISIQKKIAPSIDLNELNSLYVKTIDVTIYSLIIACKANINENKLDKAFMILEKAYFYSNYYNIIKYNKDIFFYFTLIFSRKKDFIMALVYFNFAIDEGLGCFDFIFKEQTFIDNIGDPELKIKIDKINNNFPDHNKEHYKEFTKLLENYNKKKNQNDKEMIINKKRKKGDDNDGNPPNKKSK